ncbi:spore germination protein [Bacillus sp. ISL-7]|uniref:spore germination protein n=1 Tax=Bacillus sp. ISL-7 TaxID=2819136 RepID=UPI001BE6530A|nr:spore germination protein [Bacillus sp. ISL-7]MBT2733202.1 spore germination protein [Bacillus sp. ISL-7]
MSNQINIFNLHVNGMAQNASINIGRTLHNSHTANLKLFGANFSMGDYSPANSVIITVTQDSDISDQGQNENPSSSDKSQ